MTSKRVPLWVPILAVAVISPAISVVPFTFALEGDGVDPSTEKESLILSSVWLGFVQGPAAVLTLHSMNLAFAKIPIGVHTVWACVAAALVIIVLSSFFRLGFSTIAPFEEVILGILSFIFSDILYGMIKFIPSNRVSPEGGEHKTRKKSLTRRSSNVVSLVRDDANLSDQGTALFIAATLLQREAVETLVPMQAAAILTLLYKVEVKSNAIVNGWENDDWTQTMAYIGIDLVVEVLVFVGTIVLLHRIYPEFNAARILRGLLRMHWVEMTMVSVTVWLGSLIYQSTYTGVDMTMKFPWLKCKNEANSTWLGGFEWEC